MDNRTLWTIAVIAVCSLCTMFERALPFLVFRYNGEEVQQLTYVLLALFGRAVSSRGVSGS